MQLEMELNINSEEYKEVDKLISQLKSYKRLEFGNTDQIRCLKRINKIYDSIENE